MANKMLRLQGSKNYQHYFKVMFLGAFNDNLFKNALLLLIALQMVEQVELAAFYLNIAAISFILPFLLFSGLAANWSARIVPDKVITICKWLEVVIMTIAAVFFISKQIEILLALLFLMGSQSTIFGPIKFAWLPDLVNEQSLLKANAQVEMGTFVAILLGSLAAASVVTLDAFITIIAVSCLLFALLGLFYARKLQPSPTLVNLSETIKVPFSGFNAWLLIGTSWFWFIGASLLTQLPLISDLLFSQGPKYVSWLLCAFTAGIIIAAFICHQFNHLGKLLKTSALGLSLSLLLLCLVLDSDVPASLTFIQLGLISCFSGVFVITLMTIIQQKNPKQYRLTLIAKVNWLNALFMLASGVLAIVLLSILGFGLIQYLWFLAFINFIFMSLWFYYYKRKLIKKID